MNVTRPVFTWRRQSLFGWKAPGHAPGESYALLTSPLPRGYALKLFKLIGRSGLLRNVELGAVVVYATADHASAFLRTYDVRGAYHSASVTRFGLSVDDALKKSLTATGLGEWTDDEG